MNSLRSLIVRVERAGAPDRRLDAEITAALLGPPGCVINPFATPDGWDIETAPDGGGEATYWREAADVGHLTRLVEDAIALIEELRPTDGSAVIARAFSAPPAPGSLTVVGYTERLARTLVVEALRTVALEEIQALTTRAA